MTSQSINQSINRSINLSIYLSIIDPPTFSSVPLGASTAIAAQYSVAKLANDPLLRTSISLVATGSGAAAAVAIDGDEEEEGEGGGGGESSASEHAQSASLNLAVSTALLLAITVGAVQAVFYSIASRGVIRGMVSHSVVNNRSSERVSE